MHGRWTRRYRRCRKTLDAGTVRVRDRNRLRVVRPVALLAAAAPTATTAPAPALRIALAGLRFLLPRSLCRLRRTLSFGWPFPLTVSVVATLAAARAVGALAIAVAVPVAVAIAVPVAIPVVALAAIAVGAMRPSTATFLSVITVIAAMTAARALFTLRRDGGFRRFAIGTAAEQAAEPRPETRL